MNMKTSFPTILASAVLFAGAPMFAQHANSDHHNANSASRQAPASGGKLVPVTEKDAAWAAKARQSYPLDVCLTSDEKLGSMGKSPEYIYRVAGQPDRLVIFCCDGCEEDFMKEPAKYLAKIDAAKARHAPAQKADAAKGHDKHHE